MSTKTAKRQEVTYFDTIWETLEEVQIRLTERGIVLAAQFFRDEQKEPKSTGVPMLDWSASEAQNRAVVGETNWPIPYDGHQHATYPISSVKGKPWGKRFKCWQVNISRNHVGRYELLTYLG